MKTASAISTAAHAAVLLWALVSFSGKTFEVTPAESLPVDIVSEREMSQLMNGSKTAAPAATPKPLVEKKDEPKPVDEPKPKISEKKEIQATPPAQPKADPIADALKKDETKKPEPKSEVKPMPPKKPAQNAPKFDADKVAALLDKRAPQRQAAVGEVINEDQSLGRANGTASRLSQNELEALRTRISECWNVPAGADGAKKMVVVFRVIFNPNGTVARGPDVVEATATPYGPAFAESGKRAILQCQPYTMLRRETYDSWKDMEVQFSPSDMFGG